MQDEPPSESESQTPKEPSSEDLPLLDKKEPESGPETRVPDGKTVFVVSASDVEAIPEKAKETHPPAEQMKTHKVKRREPGSITTQLKSKLGDRGRIDLSAEDLPKDVISGPVSRNRYAILGEIARGGMGAIIKIIDNDIRRPVAMKVILEDDDDERVARFVEEAQVTGQLEHPNIVPVHELGLDAKGKVYFTMKLVKGDSLESILDRIADKDPEACERFTRSHLLHIFLKVCEAIAFAHNRGVVHRDLKPENVMVGGFGEVMVMDWGLAKLVSLIPRGPAGKARVIPETLAAEPGPVQHDDFNVRTLDGDILGTPSYMPPEQADGRIAEIDQRSDIFALGGILYKILTYEAPYFGET
ncbi:MAG: serine/threonine-protein kinase, partial [Planctomycetota bacterium]